MKAVTDSGPTEPNSPMPEPIQNLFTIMKAVSTPDTVQYFTDKYNTCEIRYGDLKKQLAEDIVNIIKPISERIKEIDADNDFLKRTVKEGAEKARENAVKTVSEMRKIMGFRGLF
ncbi:MAG: tryptophan--tRNA ligase, partial [Bacteroidales bacterium]|nr:tryptophan--tRNA ligase [Bacteroidales bacterium]